MQRRGETGGTVVRPGRGFRRDTPQTGAQTKGLDAEGKSRPQVGVLNCGLGGESWQVGVLWLG